MNENQLTIYLRTALLNGFTALGLDIDVQQNFQPKRQGTTLDAALFFHKILDNRYGFNRRNSEYDEDEDEMVHNQKQIIQTTYQFNALVKRDIGNANQLTPTDILNRAAGILSSEITKKFLMEQKIGILRITDLTNTFFSDNFDQSEPSPSFDVVLTHNEELTSIVDVIQTTEFGIFRV